MNTVKIEHKLLTNAWIDDALTVMAVVRAFVRRRPLHDGCRIVLFELDGDAALHVNVTHQRSTATPAGWSGPGHTADGFVHNRRFDCTESGTIGRHIQQMVYARPQRVLAVTGAR